MKSLIYILQIFVFFLIGISCTLKSNTNRQKNTDNLKYIFFFIGDGFGITQAHLAESYLAAVNNRIGIKELHMNTFPVHGTYTTFAEDRYITGSAASGTAMATGYKTTINTISMNGEHTRHLKTMAETAKEKGMKVGIISSVSIDHATPAVFYAHRPNRNDYYEIAVQLAESNFDYFAGGGFKYPHGNPNSKKNTMMGNIGKSSAPEKELKKQTPIYDLLRKHGYQYVDSKDVFRRLNSNSQKIVAVAPRLTDGSAMPYVIDQNENDITLQEFTKKGIEILDNPKGFFMMVEGGKIDWACHANDAATTVYEVLQFDEAIKVALDFYKEHPDETLIVVGADHETGGLSLGYSNARYDTQLHLLQYQKVSNEIFNNILKAYKEKHSSNWKFEDGLELLKKYFGFNTNEEMMLDDCEISKLQTAFTASMEGKKGGNVEDYCTFYIEYGPYSPFVIEACQTLANKAGITFSTYSHTAQPIPLRAIGVGAEVFNDYYDNTHIGKRIIQLIRAC